MRGARQLLVLLRALTAIAGKAAFVQGASLYAGIAVLAGILFGGNGMDAADVTRLCRQRPLGGVLLYCLWLLVSLPVARVLLSAPAATYLRWLPVPRWRFLVVHGLHLALSQAPWVLLWARGEGAAAGLAACASGIAGHALLRCHPRPLVEGLAAPALILGLLQPRPLVLLAVALPVMAVSLRRAWLVAPLRDGAPRRPLVRGPAGVALSLAHLAVLLRGHRPALLRAGLLAALASVISFLAVRNNHVSIRTGGAGGEAASAVSLGVAAPLLCIGASGLAGPLLRAERQLRWLLLCYSTPSLVQAAAAAAPVALLCALLGIGHGLGLGLLLGAPVPLRARLVLGGALLGGILGAALTASLRWALRGDPGDSDRALLVTVAGVLVSGGAVYLFREVALFPGAMLAALLIIALAPAMPGTWARRRAERAEHATGVEP